MSVTYVTLTEDRLEELIKDASYAAVDKMLEFQSKDKALSTRDVSVKLGISISQAKNYLRDGKIPNGFQNGMSWRIMAYDLDKYIEERKEFNEKES